jgi:hypothetical protein
VSLLASTEPVLDTDEVSDTGLDASSEAIEMGELVMAFEHSWDDTIHAPSIGLGNSQTDDEREERDDCEE